VIPGVFLFILVPLASAGVLFFLRRLQIITVILATIVVGALGVGAFSLPLDRSVELGGRQVALGEPVTLLGRQLVMTPAHRAELAVIFLMAAVLFLIGARFGSGQLFIPVGMSILGLLSAALVIRPFVFAALFLTLAALMATILFQSTGQTRGAFRYLVIMTLALPAFMIANWMVDAYQYNPTDVVLPRSIMLALAGGFALLLGVVPFHIWIRPSVEESPPLAAAFVFTVSNSVNWFLMFDVLQEYPWLVNQQDIFRILQLLGLLTAVVGAVLAFSSHDFSHVMGYGVMADCGCALLTLGTRTSAGLSAVMLATLARPVSLAVLALGIALARERLSTSHFEKLSGQGWSNPWTTLALTVGGFSLAGIPPLAGFVGRWAQTHLLASAVPWYFVAVLGSTFGVAAGTLRGVDYLLQPKPESAVASLVDISRRREPRLMVVLVLLSVLLALMFGMFPGLVEPVTRTIASSYTFFASP
jgi:formate hydrogenlyase subunit 3/multisubunit Na+/H+ antiporter MnhD subunit